MGIGSMRNKNCYCGSGRKFKKCHLLIDTPANMFELRTKIFEFISKQKKTDTTTELIDTPPDLGVSVKETVNAADKFGQK